MTCERTPVDDSPAAPARTAVAALVSIAAVSVPSVVCLYVLALVDGTSATADYAGALFAAAPLTVLAALGLRTFLLTRTGPDLARALALRLATAPLVLAGTGLWMWWTGGSSAVLVGLAVGAVRATDNVQELWVVQSTLLGQVERVIARCTARAAVTTGAGLVAIAVGAGSVSLAGAQAAVAVVWLLAHDLPRLDRPRLAGPGMMREMGHYVPYGAAGVAAIAAFAVPRALAGRVLDDHALGRLAVVTTLPLVLGMGLTAVIEMLYGPRAARPELTRVVVRAASAATVLLSASLGVLLASGGGTVVELLLSIVAVCLSAVAATFTVVLHAGRRTVPVVWARGLAAALAAMGTMWAAHWRGVVGVVGLMAAAQAITAAILATVCIDRGEQP